MVIDFFLISNYPSLLVGNLSSRSSVQIAWHRRQLVESALVSSWRPLCNSVGSRHRRQLAWFSSRTWPRVWCWWGPWRMRRSRCRTWQFLWPCPWGDRNIGTQWLGRRCSSIRMPRLVKWEGDTRKVEWDLMIEKGELFAKNFFSS